jgi:beta-glucanase (GH16 family)
MGRNVRCLGLAILLLVGAVGVGAGAPGRGLHSAFWGKPASEAWPPELDVEEIGGDRPDTVIMTNHWRDDSGHRQKTQRWRGPDFSDSYHVFGAEWSPEETVWYVDGVERARTTAGAAEMSAGGPFYVLLNLQVGLGGAAQPSAATRFPAYQLVDYVRIWDRPFDFLTP